MQVDPNSVCRLLLLLSRPSCFEFPHVEPRSSIIIERLPTRFDKEQSDVLIYIYIYLYIVVKRLTTNRASTLDDTIRCVVRPGKTNRRPCGNFISVACARCKCTCFRNPQIRYSYTVTRPFRRQQTHIRIVIKTCARDIRPKFRRASHCFNYGP